MDPGISYALRVTNQTATMDMDSIILRESKKEGTRAFGVHSPVGFLAQTDSPFGDGLIGIKGRKYF